jgi:hypothetical protein
MPTRSRTQEPEEVKQQTGSQGVGLWGSSASSEQASFGEKIWGAKLLISCLRGHEIGRLKMQKSN